eukprot:g766.t1
MMQRSFHLIVIIAAVLAVYLSTIYESLPGGDSGELMVAACNMAQAHPPGYPLWTILASVFYNIIPLGGTPAWRINTLSAVCSALASGLIALAVEIASSSNPSNRGANRDRKIFSGVGAGLFAAGTFAFSPTVWLYSLQGEVFALNNFLVSLLLVLFISFEYQIVQPNCSYSKALLFAWSGSLVSGFCLSNQHTTIFIVISFAPWVIYRLHRPDRGTPLTWRIIFSLGLCGLLGLSPYLHLYVAASKQRKDGWGNQTTWDGFRRHLLREEYGTFQLTDTDGDVDDFVYFWLRLRDYMINFWEEGLMITVPLSIIGALQLAWRSCGGFVLLFSHFFYLCVISFLANMDTERPLMKGVYKRFWMQPNVFMFFWAGVGYSTVIEQPLRRLGSSVFSKANKTKEGNRKNIMQFHIASLMRCFAVAVALTIAVFQCHRNFSFRDFSKQTFVADYGRDILSPLPVGSLLMVSEDINNNSVKYLQECEGYRRDVKVVSVALMTYEWWGQTQAKHYPDVIFPNLRYHPYEKDGYSMAEFIGYNIQSHQVFLAGSWYDNDGTPMQVFERHFYGMSDRLLPKKEYIGRSMLAGVANDIKIPLVPFRPFHSKLQKLSPFHDYAKQLWKALPRHMSLPPISDGRFDDESWEAELRKKFVAAILNPAMTMTTEVDKNKFDNGTVEEKAEEMERASLGLGLYKHMFEKIAECEVECQLWVREFIGVTQYAQHLRNAGILAGYISKYTPVAEALMVKYWTLFVEMLQREDVQLSAAEQMSIPLLMKEKLNPYRSEKFQRFDTEECIAYQPYPLKVNASKKKKRKKKKKKQKKKMKKK